MTMIENPDSSLLHHFVQESKETSAASDTELANVVESDVENRKKWNEIIDTLLEWWKHPNQLIWDDDFIAPSRDVVGFSCKIADQWREKKFLPIPDRVVPNGEGGITFKVYHGQQQISLTINFDRKMEILYFDDCCLVERQPVG